MTQARPQVPLLATVVLLLDDEGAGVGEQIAALCQSLDPLAASRLRMLRVSGLPGAAVASPFIPDAQRQVAARPDPRLAHYGVPGVQYRVTPDVFAQSDPGITNLAAPQSPNLYGTPLTLETALRGMLQEVARSGGAEPLAERGYRLAANELAISLVGRVESPLLDSVAATTQRVTRSLAAQTDTRRLAFLLAADLNDTPGAEPPPQFRSRPLAGPPAPPDWRAAAAAQPWSRLLSWRDGEPPLLYAFLYEAWDEASRYHWRSELRYAIAESIVALFTTGALDHPALKDALDLSTAALDDTGGLTRIGSIGTSRISSPTEPMIDYLAHRLAADLLLRRGLLGREAGQPIPSQAAATETARQDADRWIKDVLRRRLEGERHPLPERLPARDLDALTMHKMALSQASPDPAGNFWHWGPQHTGRVRLDDEAYWNFVAQNEFETAQEAHQWSERLLVSLPAVQHDLHQHAEAALSQRTNEIEGVERAGAFATALSDALLAEARRIQHDQDEQEQQIAAHQRRFEDDLRAAHRGRGIPTMPNPPANNDLTPLMPRNMEAIAHEVIDDAFNRAPMPLTLLLAALVVTAFGALAIDPLAHLALVAHGASSWQVALATGPARHLVGMAFFLGLFVVALIAPLVAIARLGRWQRRYAEARTLLWLARARRTERTSHLQVIQALVQQIDRQRSHIRGWEAEVEDSAAALVRDATGIAGAFLTSAALSRDVYVARGTVWEGLDPDDLYLRVRQQQADEVAVVRAFLRAVQSASGDVAHALNANTLESQALEFMRRHLRDGVGDDPFAMWDAETAAAVLDRAREAARIPIQPLPGGRPSGHFDAVAMSPDVAWIPRLAEERHMVTLPLASPRWGLVIRVATRAHHALVR